MPSYDFSCTANPEHRRDNLIFGIHEYAEKTLKDKPCEECLVLVDEDGTETSCPCPGTYEHTFENARPGHSFKGDGWTPKFYR